MQYLYQTLIIFAFLMSASSTVAFPGPQHPITMTLIEVTCIVSVRVYLYLLSDKLRCAIYIDISRIACTDAPRPG